MSDKHSPEFTQTQSGGHPHDLLARLYREIGISAVAAALEASQFVEKHGEAGDRRDPSILMGEDLAA